MDKEPIYMEDWQYEEYLKKQEQRAKEKAAELGEPLPERSTIAETNLYQMNKDIIRSLKKMNNMDINHALEKVADWYIANDAKHFALLNHEKCYFTIFEVSRGTELLNNTNAAVSNFIKELKDILQNWYGDNDIRSIECDVIDGEPTGAVEIWGMWEGEPSVGYLFPYDEGVVYF